MILSGGNLPNLFAYDTHCNCLLISQFKYSVIRRSVTLEKDLQV